MPAGNNLSVSASARSAYPISLGSDTVGVLYQALWVGTGGTVIVDMADTGTTVSFINVPNGTMLPIAVSKIYSTSHGTSASNLVGLVW